jgi:hypothetical protein
MTSSPTGPHDPDIPGHYQRHDSLGSWGRMAGIFVEVWLLGTPLFRMNLDICYILNARTIFSLLYCAMPIHP